MHISNELRGQMDGLMIKPIGVIHTSFPEKFGIPRQSGIVDTPGYIRLFEPYNDPNSVRGLEEFSHIWLIWQVSENLEMIENFSPTVRPPRLGGNTRVGIFATRSPFHPNAMGLSCVKLERIEFDKDGLILVISGADVLDGTPLYDIKPYIKTGDMRPDAICGFVDKIESDTLEVELEAGDEGLPDSRLQESIEHIDERTLDEIKALLACNPKPRYQDDSERVYGMRYGDYEVRFRIEDGIAFLAEIIDRRI